ncbi:AAC(3)-I family aminoglycoside 3-N-acetyltransferase [Sphingobacterium haloxyli]|uniref:AAC(3)-I family aminoglycoside 3-N-acetyltransferase n=2 Tax=Sphingobacterium haloxyli TaxID=2100533 RepID=A0A2S9J5C6_9SPHI|nr:AAC(3)-I family aminoglycoside 3-N-acetyltransferase [Sphingobacterium haloxyli]
MKNRLMEIKKLSKEDISLFEKLIKLFEDVFEMKSFNMPNVEHLHFLLAKEEFHAFVALDDSCVIGGLTAYTLNQYYSTKPLAYIFDLAVLRTHQRQGLGKELIQQTKVYFKQQGFEEVFVQADNADEYAVDFYRKTYPAQEENVFHFSYFL